jgi:hypothetical protein
MKIKNWQKKVHRGQVPGGHAYTRTSMEPDTLGRAAVLRVHTPIRVDPMRREKCCVSFAITRPSEAANW